MGEEGVKGMGEEGNKRESKLNMMNMRLKEHTIMPSGWFVCFVFRWFLMGFLGRKLSEESMLLNELAPQPEFPSFLSLL